MTPPDVLYCIEHVARELNAACAVRAVAREKFGLRVHVHVLSDRADPVLAGRPPGLLAIPYCTSRNFVPRHVLRRFPHVPVVNLACEQLLSPGNRRYRLPQDDFSRQQVVHIAAGEFFQEWLHDAGVPLDRIELTGSTTFQLYRTPYRDFFQSHRPRLAAAHGLDGQLPWILLPENFAAAFFSRSHIRKRVRGGYDRGQLAAYVSYARRSFTEIAKWCARAAALGTAEIIIRPRPAISQSVFSDEFFAASASHPQRHLHFIKQGNVAEWIFASQLVVSSYSTTLLEAAVADRPAAILARWEAPESAASQWHQAAPRITRADDFLDIVRAPETAPAADGLRDWAEQNLVGYGDAIKNVAQLMAEICAAERTVPLRIAPSLQSQVATAMRDGLRQSERVFRQRLRPRRRRVFGHECDEIDRTGIDSRTTTWAELMRGVERRRAA